MAYLNFYIDENNCYIVPTNSPIINENKKINYPVIRVNGKPIKTRKLVF